MLGQWLIAIAVFKYSDLSSPHTNGPKDPKGRPRKPSSTDSPRIWHRSVKGKDQESIQSNSTACLTVKMFFSFQNEICCPCPICYSLFNESKTKTPRLLQCGHTVCHACLQNIIKESVIECPICRDLTPVMYNKVENLKQNFALIGTHSGQKVGKTYSFSSLGCNYVIWASPWQKPTKWSVRPAKTQISLGICPVWSVFAVRLMTQGLYMRTVNTLIRLDGYPGWSKSLQGAQVILLVLSCAGHLCEILVLWYFL